MSDKPVYSGIDAAVNAFLTPAEAEEAQPQAVEEAPSEGEDLTAGSEAELEETSEDQDAPEDEVSEEEETGEPSDNHDEQDQEDEGDETYEVRVDGEPLEVTLGELKAGYMKDADYRRKTQSVAEDRKVVAEQKRAVDDGAQSVKAIVDHVANLVIGSPVAMPNPADYGGREAEYQQARYAYDQWVASSQQWQQAQQEILKEVDGKRTAETQKEGIKEAKAFVEAFKLTDQIQFQAKVGELQGFAKSTYPIPENVLNGIVHHGFYLMADDAKKWRDLQDKGGKKARIKAKQAKVKPVSGSRNQQTIKQPSEGEKANERFNRTVSQPAHTLNRNQAIDAAVGAFLANKQ